MSTKRLYKIVLVFFTGLFILGIGYIYSTFYGNPVVKLIAKHHIQEYVQLKYPENYSMGKVTYNFKNQNYSSVVRDNNKKKYTEIHYYSNAVTDINEMELSDSKEEKILNDKLKNKIGNLLQRINFKFEDLICDSCVCINANQKFEEMKDLDRYDFVTIRICNKNEISKDEFAEMTLAIFPEIKANMYCKKGSYISINYQFEKQDRNYSIEFLSKESDINLSKEYIMKNANIKAY